MVSDKKHDIGQFQRDRSASIKAAVKAHYEAHPFTRVKDCAQAIGVTPQTVQRFVAQLREEARSSSLK